MLKLSFQLMQIVRVHKITFAAMLSAALLLCLWCNSNLYSHSKSTFQTREVHTLLWWAGMRDHYAQQRFCGTFLCNFTNERQALTKAKAVMFYASSMEDDDWPLPRQPAHLWALLHEESPVNVVYLPHERVLRHFNYTSTSSRHSNFPLTTHHLEDMQQLTSPTYLVPIGEKTRLRKQQKLAPIAFLQSNCEAMSARELYVQELMKHIAIDSYGKCLHNRELPASLQDDYLNNLYLPELMHFLARYKFILAIENGVCEDYITEKFWRPLIAGSVPVYFGSPSIRDFQPNTKSIINIADFESPKALADFLLQLDANDTEYISYLNHKYELLKPIDNENLAYVLRSREFPIGVDNNIFASFECYMCAQVHRQEIVHRTQWATKSHYDCPLPLIFPKMPQKIATADKWQSVMAVGRCEAEILDTFLLRNKNFTKQQFQELLTQQVNDNKCNS